MRKEVHLDISSFDFGWDGDEVEYIDLNPDPTLEWWNLGEHDFSRLVDGAVTLLKNYLTPATKPALKRTNKKSAPNKKG